MQKTKVLAVALLLNCIFYTNSLKCYNCLFNSDGEGQWMGDFSCEFGVPDIELSEECTKNSTIPLALVNPGEHQLSNKGITVAEFMTSRGLSTDQVAGWGCAKIFWDGEFQYPFEGKLIGVNRHCYPLTTEELACKNDTSKGWLESAESGEPWAVYISEIAKPFTEESKISTCLCGEENCNMDSDGGITTAI